ncbi:MAG: hypothetical protein J7L90_03315, partial [Dehalococcoidia bacterium]|nr:hypothetical protein [Dehalococcoidia bacterium]
MKRKLLFVSLALVIALLGVVGCTSEQEEAATPAPTPASTIAATPTIPAVSYVTPPVVTGSTQNVGIWVSGEGKVTVTPDLVILTLGI